MASVTASAESADRPTQNWVISPAGDFLLIVAAPALALLWALSVLSAFGAFAVLSIFVVFNTAHHLPTFIRIYGDRDLMQRFRWRLLLGPIVPFTLAFALVTFLLVQGLSIEHAFCLWIILSIWDPWHFIMQHYGFMRIYDRFNRAPPLLAARMDMMIAFSWFIFIMFSVTDWLPELLYNLTIQNSVPILYYFDDSVFSSLRWLSFGVAIFATIVYSGYIVWCLQKGFFVSWAKITMVAVTFGIMYLTYVPNSAMDAIIGGIRSFWPQVPDWSFRLGFATVGMVHVTQYLAIVWKYNRGLVKRAGGRSGIFTNAFVRGGLLVAAGYVLLCLIYGFLLTDRVHPFLIGTDRPIADAPLALQFVIGFLMAGLFTSTILHYYFDGFIWKVRHKENREALDIQNEGDPTELQAKPKSWWDNVEKVSIARTLGWQLLYFAVPMTFLAVTYAFFMSSPASRPLSSLNQVLQVPPEQRTSQTQLQAVEALASAQERLAVEQRMTELRPRGDHYAYASQLIQAMSAVQRTYLPDRFSAAEARQSTKAAIDAIEHALSSGGPFEHAEGRVTEEELQRDLENLRRRLVDAPRSMRETRQSSG